MAPYTTMPAVKTSTNVEGMLGKWVCIRVLAVVELRQDTGH